MFKDKLLQKWFFADNFALNKLSQYEQQEALK